METEEEQFGSEIHAALPLFQRHAQLMVMARYFNDATVSIGAQAPLPQPSDGPRR